jgi:hypothetical protein
VIRVLVVLEVLASLALCGYVVIMSNRPATSMDITVWTQVTEITVQPGKEAVFPPPVEVFNKIITDQPLVQDTEQQLDGLHRNVGFDSGISASPAYVYQFSFATNGVPTEVYAGNLNGTVWSVTTWGITDGVEGPGGATLYGFNLMTMLRTLTGMPLPSWWNATLPAN